MATLQDLWPPAAVVVRTPRLELRWPSQDDLVALATLAGEGVHDEAAMPFMTPWTRGTPDERSRSVLQWNWRTAGEWEPGKWSMSSVAVVEGAIVGTQGMQATDFGVCRVVETGSWLGLAHQGRGIGKEMRAAILHLIFAGLGADRAMTGAFDDNPASLGVTRALGYRPNGERWMAVEGRSRRELLFVLDRDDWQSTRRDDIELHGVEPALPLFGAVGPTAPAESEVEGPAASG
jgi:RimJ/RimL family protein N-acetyltransferase